MLRHDLKNILSVQANSMGHKTYGNLMRRFAPEFEGLNVIAVWSDEGRSLTDRIIRRMCEVNIPLLSVRNLDYRRARVEWATARMSRNLARQNLLKQSFDALHFHTQVQVFNSAAIMKKTPSVILIDITSYQLATEYQAGPFWSYLPTIRMEKKVFQAAAHIVTFSDWARQSVIFDHLIPEHRVTTVYPGVDLDIIGQPKFEISEIKKILFVGNNIRRKGGFDLFDVFVSGIFGSAELYVMSNDAVDFNHPKIFWHIGVSAYTSKWFHIFRSADIFVLPSYRDCFPNVLQEAAAFGLALIGSDVGGIPEIVMDGKNGFLVMPGKKEALSRSIKILLEHETILNNMRHASRQLAIEKFDARANFTKFFALLNSVA